MIRLAVLADIHGNMPALQAVLRDMEQFAPDQVVVAGDSVNWGPYSREVMEIVSASRWAVIRGNNELYALDFGTPRMPAHWASFTLPPILRAQLGAAWLNALACLPDELSLRFPDAPALRIVHGIPGDPFQAVYPGTPRAQIANWLANVDETTVICAHSHIALERRVDRWRVFNPGSVGIPLDGEFSASYMLLDGDHSGWSLHTHRRVPFSNEANLAAFEAQRYVEQGGVTAQLVIEEFRSARLRLHPFLMWKKRACPDTSASPEILEAFLDLDDLDEFILPAYRDLQPALFRDCRARA